MGVLGGVRSTAEGLVCDNIGLGRSVAMRDVLVEDDFATEQSQCRSTEAKLVKCQNNVRSAIARIVSSHTAVS